MSFREWLKGVFRLLGMGLCLLAGVPGVIGTCGTALTQEQAALLKRLADRVVVVFDGDAAGRKAAETRKKNRSPNN